MTAGPAPARTGRPLWWAAGAVVVAAGGYFGGAHLYRDWQLREAVRAEQARDFARAADLLGRYRAARPADPSSHLLAARLGWRTRLRDPLPPGWAKQPLDHLAAAEADPALIDRAGRERQAVAALSGDPAAAAALDRRAADAGPDAVALLEAVTRAALDGHRLAAAERAADRLLAASPDHPLGHFWRGLARDLAGREGTAAEADLRRAVELDPDNHDFRLWLAGYLAKFPATAAEAQQLFRVVALARPADREALFGLGLTAAANGDTATARPALSYALQLAPGHPAAMAALGKIELDAGRNAEAEPLLRRAAELAPGMYGPNADLAVCLFRLGREAEAAPFRERADKAKADDARLRELLKEAAAKPTPAAATEIGTLYLRAGQTALGETWLWRAVELDPGYEPARAALRAAGKKD